MKKKFLVGLMVAALSVSMTACSNINFLHKLGEGNVPADAQTSSPEMTQMGESSEDLYKSFLANNVQVFSGNQHIYGGYDYETGESIDLLEAGKGYNLVDFVKKVAGFVDEEYGDIDLEKVSYAYLDCGMDGEPELALSLEFQGGYMGYLTQQYVIKDIDGKLTLCAKLESAYRYEECFKNKYGVVFSSGSSGATSGSTGYSYINDAGEKIFLYSADCERGLGCYYDGAGGVYTVAAEYVDDIDDEWYLMQYHFDDPANFDFLNIDYEAYLHTLYYTVYPEGEPLIEQIFAEADTPIYSETQMEEMLAQNIKDKGLSQEIFDSEDDVEWTEVVNETISEIIKYGANPIYVSSTEEFVAALADGANIVLMPGTYNVTEYILSNQSQIPCDTLDGVKVQGVYQTGDLSEPGFMIYGYEGLKISSMDENNKSEIVSEPRFELVVDFSNCYNISINNIIMGHTPDKGSCGGDVIGFNGCQNIFVNGCDLYGCGAYGTCIMDSMLITFNNTRIHDCTYGCAEVYDSDSVSFDSCKFEDCEGAVMFYNFGSYISLYSCEFKNLDGELIWMDENGHAYFGDCTFDQASLDSINNYADSGELSIY